MRPHGSATYRPNPALPACVSALLRRAEERPEGASAEWVRRQRLEPVLHGVAWTAPVRFPDGFMAECRQAYFNMIGRAERFLREAQGVMALISAAGLRGFAWRGALYGRDLYGDAALRYCADVDVMVEPASRWRALEVLQAAGYRLRGRSLPAWYLGRHHLHWPLVGPDGQIPVDVHWAVDHPYSATPVLPREVFEGALRDEAPSRILLACLHAEKESRLRLCATEEEAKGHVLEEGPIWPWLDLALMLSSLTGQGGVPALRRLAEACSCRLVLERSLTAVAQWFELSLDAEPWPNGPIRGSSARPRAGPAGRWAGRWAERMGCRPGVLLDWREYVSEGRTVRARLARVSRVWRLGVESLLALLWLRLRSRPTARRS